jgi:putative DNA modification/repair radical SAM protein
VDVIEKLAILGDAARFDVACTSSGSERSASPGGGIGNTVAGGICHSWTDDGRCISLLKVLLTNHCDYDCVYCRNRSSNDVPRAAFRPEELAMLTIEFYRRNYIEGLFLSSGVVRDADHTMALMIETLRLLREEHRFRGYVHVKVIPGASAEAVERIGLLADRVSVNVELPSTRSLLALAPQKKPAAIEAPMAYIATRRTANRDELVRYRGAPAFAPAGQSTQLIVGATPDRDAQILRLSKNLYSRFEMKRVFFSAYIPTNTHSLLPAVTSAPPLLREHRLYQADWLMRFYRFDVEEIVDSGSPDLDLDLDPKSAWAMRHLDRFPVDVNRADYETLLRVPGIGVLSAQRVLAARRLGRLRAEDLKPLGIVMKRARFFLAASGRYTAERIPQAAELRMLLADKCGQKGYAPFQLRIEDLPVVGVGA